MIYNMLHLKSKKLTMKKTIIFLVSLSFIITTNAQDVIFGETDVTEGGPANMVTAIVADYRSFDTLGEITVLFVSSLGVALLLGATRQKRMDDFWESVGYCQRAW